jgi:dimethylhistidine N-methyltransferase
MKTSVLFDDARSDSRPLGHVPEADGRVVDLVSHKAADTPRVIVQAKIDEIADREALRAGLLAHPASTSPKFFYDPQGSALFTAICSLAEYYPTRTEAGIFERCRDEVARAMPANSQWIDLGCGDGAKARGWLDAAQVRRYVGVDIAETWLRTALAALASERARLMRPNPRVYRAAIEIVGVVTDFTRPFDLHGLLDEEPDMAPVFFYPGSSIGNFAREDARAFLASVRKHIERHASGGKLLIGVDLVKDRATLLAAYDDALGVTAAFNRNVLRVANRLLDADFDPAAFAHRAVFDEDFNRIEMQLVSTRSQVVRIASDARRFDDGEAIVTEYSHKYTVDGFSSLLEAAGFAGGDRLHRWTDEREWFGVFVAEPA